MIRIDKAAVARLGFGGATADRHTNDRLYKKVQTKVRGLEAEPRPKAVVRGAKEEVEALPLLKAGGCRYVLDLERAYDAD